MGITTLGRELGKAAVAGGSKEIRTAAVAGIPTLGWEVGTA